ncbi:multidrug resistance secretion protein [Klebsiella pneumoniae]|uniref:Multidrug resistance secretion protein n=1 Tax=Klebsiella pneumoniae TaxID=573 RepID=A0A378F6G0_KLEPN|nr:multidrug resistance secretion protein [Klebsiella pneumoniae]
MKKGDLLIRIDDRDYRAALAKAAGEVARPAGRAGRYPGYPQLQQATIAALRLVTGRHGGNRKLANDNRRYNALAASSAISAQIRDNASADYRRAHAEQEKAKADKNRGRTSAGGAGCSPAANPGCPGAGQANLEMARLNLSYTDIRARSMG